MSQVESIEEKIPTIPTSVLSQQVESGSADSFSDERNFNRWTESSDEGTSLSSGDVSLNKNSYQMMQRNNENRIGNDRIRDQFGTSVESQSEGQCVEREGSFDGATSERDLRLPVQSISKSDDPCQDFVSLDRFEKVSKEAALLKQELEALKQSGGDLAELDRQRRALQNENYHLKEELKKIRSMLIMDENGSLMEPKQVILLREENMRLASKIAILEKRPDEPRNMSITNRVQYNPSPESSVVVAPNIDGMIHKIDQLEVANCKLLKEKTKLEKEVEEMHHTIDEVFDASDNRLQKLLKAEKDKNRKLEEDCKVLKYQVETFQGDYDAQREEWRKKESQWDIKFTRERATIAKLERQVKDQAMEIMRLHAQYQREFTSKMKIQEEFEKQRHVPSQTTTCTPGPDSFSQISVMHSDMSFELITCESCSATFPSMSELQSHRKACCGRGVKPRGYQTQV